MKIEMVELLRSCSKRIINIFQLSQLINKLPMENERKMKSEIKLNSGHLLFNLLHL